MKSNQNLQIRIDHYRDHSKTIFIKSKIEERTSEEEVVTGTGTVTLMLGEVNSEARGKEMMRKKTLSTTMKMMTITEEERDLREKKKILRAEMMMLI